MNHNKLVSDFLIYCCAYYKYGKSLISDMEFDTIVHTLKDEWDNVEHMHKHLITMEMLDTTSAYHIKDYPQIVENITRELIHGV